MRSIIFWLPWMLLIGLVIAANSSGEWAKELEAVSQAPFIFVGAFIALYAVIVIPTIGVISKDTTKTTEAKYGGEIKVLKSTLEADEKENKRLEAKIAELEKQIQSQSNQAPQPLKPVSVIEVSESQTKPLLLEPEKLKDQSSIKIRACKLAKQIEKVTEKALAEEKINNNNLYDVEAGIVRKIIDEGFVPYDQTPQGKASRIRRNAIEEYNTDIHNIALKIREELVPLSKNNPLSLENYSCPQSLEDLNEISSNLRLLADGIPD
jgi:hypothetical protein